MTPTPLPRAPRISEADLAGRPSPTVTCPNCEARLLLSAHIRQNCPKCAASLVHVPLDKTPLAFAVRA